jgi:hypothetical protein
MNVEMTKTQRIIQCIFVLLLISAPLRGAGLAVFNVKDYGATGNKSDDARPAIQKAIDECAKAGGGKVYLPPGEYTSGTIFLRSHVRFHLEAGATLFASQDPKDFRDKPEVSQPSLFYGSGIENVSIEGRGTVNGQSEYEWRADDIEDVFLREAKRLMLSQGKSILRPFPNGHPQRTLFPQLVWIGDSEDIQIRGVSLIYSPSWTMTFRTCERVVVDGIYLHTKLDEAVWADGIDLDGCKDVMISNSVIETGDDCIAIFSGDFWGPARVCENIAVTNCRLSSSANAVKFTEGNVKGVRHAVISNCVISDDSSGFSFLTADGGFVSDVLISNITMDLRRFGWYYGQGGPFGFMIKRRNEWTGDPVKKEGYFPGSIHDIAIRNMVVRAKGRAHVDGHPASWIDGLNLDNIKIYLSSDPSAPFDRAKNAIDFRYIKNLKLKDFEIHWDTPASEKWESAISMKDVEGLVIDGFEGRQAWPDRDVPAVVLEDVSDAWIRNSRAPEGTATFLKVAGKGSRDIRLTGNDLRKARKVFVTDPDVASDTVKEIGTLR